MPRTIHATYYRRHILLETVSHTVPREVAASAADPECAEHGPGTGDGPDIVSALIQLSGVVQGIYTCVSDSHELTPAQARLACALLDGPRGMAELGQFLGVEKAAMTGLMDRVERRGLAGRSTVEGDRRALRVTLTDEGRDIAAAFHAELGAELGLLVAHLPPEDTAHLRRTIAGIIDWCAHPGSAEPQPFPVAGTGGAGPTGD